MAKSAKVTHVSETPATALLRAQGVAFTEHPYDYIEHGGATHSAEVKGATSGAVTGAIGGTAYGPGREDAEDRADRAGWVAQCEALGVDRALAERTIHSALVLTTARVLVVRRSSLTRRLGEPIGAWPVTEAHVDVPRGEQTLTLRVGDAPLRFELPQAHRFLPDVYRELPALVARARAQATGS